MANRLDHLVASRPRITRRAIAGLALGLPLGAACSLALNFDDTKACSSDDECMYTTGQGSCVDGFCQPPGGGQESGDTVDPTTMGPTDGTTTTDPTADSTTTMSDEDSTSSTTGPSGCVMNSDCADDQVCHEDVGQCVSLLSKECTTIVWPGPDPEDRDNVVFLASIMPTSPPFDELVEPLQNAHQLGIQDFNDVTSLQGGRKIAWVGCDSTGGADVAVAAAEHLRDNVRAPAIVGPVFSEAVRQVAEQVTVPAGMFIISPTASAPSLSNFMDDNLVWRVTPSDDYQANALIDRFTQDLSPAPARMLVLNKNDAYGNELQQLIAADLLTDLAPAVVHFASYEGPENYATEMDLLLAYNTVLTEALTEPGIAQMAGDYDSPDDHYTHILIIGTSEAEAFILGYAGAWAQFYSGFAPFPLITVSHGGVPSLEGTVNNAFGMMGGLEMLAPLIQTMLRGTSPNIFDPENFNAFNIRYNLTFGGPALTSSSLSYDAALATIFAMVTVPAEDEVTGTAIAAGMASLIDAKGTAISFGDPVNVFVQDARNALAGGGTVDLQGVSGALDWDPATGDIRADVLGWNVGDGTMGEPVALDPYCIYALAPGEEFGQWINLSTGMPPCN